MKFFIIFLACFNAVFATCQTYTFSNYPNQYFVETGCHEGYGIQNALNAGFKHIYSIEVQQKYIDYCRNRFAFNPEVHIIAGDSGQKMHDVIKDINAPITFWLDAHLADGHQSCPIMLELAAIKQHPIKTHTILIDDVRLFDTHFFDFLPLSKVIEKIKEINPNYKISYILGHIPNDILVAEVK